MESDIVLIRILLFYFTELEKKLEKTMEPQNNFMEQEHSWMYCNNSNYTTEL